MDRVLTDYFEKFLSVSPIFGHVLYKIKSMVQFIPR